MSLFKNLFGMGNSAYEDLNASQFAEDASQNKEAVILDVRTAAEYQSGHLPKSKNIDVMKADFGSRIAQLDKEKTYYVYCRSGGRSASACQAMTSMGFTKVYNMRGGIMSYRGKLA